MSRNIKLANNEIISILCYQRGELNPALYGEQNAIKMTVADSLKKDSMGRNEFHTARGTLTVIAKLVDPAEFEQKHGVVLACSSVFVDKTGRPSVRVKEDWEIEQEKYEAEKYEAGKYDVEYDV